MGPSLGKSEGEVEGEADGEELGKDEGKKLGRLEGVEDGATDGSAEGRDEGNVLGSLLGPLLGSWDGTVAVVGDADGKTSKPSTPATSTGISRLINWSLIFSTKSSSFCAPTSNDSSIHLQKPGGGNELVSSRKRRKVISLNRFNSEAHPLHTPVIWKTKAKRFGPRIVGAELGAAVGALDGNSV